MAESISDAQLIEKSLSAPEVFGQVFEHHWNDVFSYFERRFGPELAADLAAEVFRIAFERRISYAVEMYPNCLPWLYGIAAKLTLKEHRRFARHLAAVERLNSTITPTSGDLAGTVAARLDSETTWSQVTAALISMADETREMLLLIVWEELSYQEVADAFAIPVGTVRSRIHRARRLLRARLGARISQVSGVEGAGSDERD